MSAAESSVRLAAATLPSRLRDRYREQWLADVRDAGELGVSRLGIVVGALLFSLTLGRGYEAYGYTPSEIAVRRARWGLALVLSAPIALFGLLLSGARLQDAPLTPGALALNVVLLGFVTASGVALLAGCWQLWRAAREIGRTATVGTVLCALGTVGFFASVGPMIFGLTEVHPLVGVLATTAVFVTPMVAFGGLITAFIGWMMKISAVPTTPAGPRNRTTRTVRAWTGIACAVGILIVIAIGTIESLVWSPLAMTDPQYSLSEIYAMLSEGDRQSGIASVVVWAVFWSIVTLGLLIPCLLRARPDRVASLDTSLTPRRIVVVALGLLGLVMFFQGWSGFSLGMSISDTVPPLRGGRSWQGQLYSLLGCAAIIAAICGSLVPGRATSTGQQPEENNRSRGSNYSRAGETSPAEG